MTITICKKVVVAVIATTTFLRPTVGRISTNAYPSPGVVVMSL